MNNINKIIPSDIFKREEYSKIRKDIRTKMVERKKKRRLEIGPYITVYFENKDTLIHQINEMVFIENGGQEQVVEEIKAYESLLPNGKELVITLMVEIDNPRLREKFLSNLGGIEESLKIKVNGKFIIDGRAEKDFDRTTAEGKASSVQFIHFQFSEEIISAFKLKNSKIELEINHKAYKHVAIINRKSVEELSKDFICAN